MPIRTYVSQKTVRELLRYDGRTGSLTWRVDRSRTAKAGDKAGTPRTDGRTSVMIKGRLYLAHHLIWLYVHGDLPEGRLIFWDKDPTNMRLSNIREEAETFSDSPAAAYQRQHRKKRRAAINRGWLDAKR